MLPNNSRVLVRWIDHGIAVGLVGNLGWTTWHLGGAMAGPMAGSFTVMMGLLSAVILRRTWLSVPAGLPSGWWWPLPFLIYVAFQVGTWGATPGRGWLDGLNWGWMIAGFWVSLHVMREQSARRMVWLGVGVITLGLVALAGYQRLGDASWLPAGRTQIPQFLERSGGAFGAPNNLAGWMILILPLAAVVGLKGQRDGKWGRWIAVLVLLGGSVALLWTYSRGSWLALGGALMIWPMLNSRQSWGARWIRVLVVAVLGGIASTGVYLTVPKAKERVDQLYHQSGELTRPILWRAAWGNVRTNPWLGTGGGSYEVMLERHRPFRFWDETKWAHNDYLNTLSDYGLVGFGLSFGVGAVLIFVQIKRAKSRQAQGAVDDDPHEANGLMVGLIAMALALLVDFHLKVPAVSLLAGIVVADWLNRMTPTRAAVSVISGPRTVLRVAGGLIAAGVLFFGRGEAAPKFEAEGLRFLAREKIDRAAPIEDLEELRRRIAPALAPLEQATRLFPGSERAWSDLAYMRALRANWEPASAGEFGIEAEEAARRGLALCDQDWETWVRLGTALDLQGRWGEAGLAFGEAVKIASNSTSAWYYQAFHLSLQPAARPVAEAALATCLRLDPWNPDGEALRASFERDRK